MNGGPIAEIVRRIATLEETVRRIASRQPRPLAWLATTAIDSATVTSYTATLGDAVIYCNTTTAGITIVPPAAASAKDVTYFIFKTNAGANNVTIDPPGGELINGAATLAFNTQYGCKIIHCDGSAWYVLSGS